MVSVLSTGDQSTTSTPSANFSVSGDHGFTSHFSLPPIFFFVPNRRYFPRSVALVDNGTHFPRDGGVCC